MATAAAALLDELMGKNRNALPDENFSGIKWSDAEVCKHYLVDFCPNELFVNTRSDLGQCEKIHDDHMKKEYKESSRFQHMGYEEDFMQYLQQIMNDVEKRIKRGHSRLALNSNRPNLTAPSRGADEEQIRILTDRINSLVEQVEQLGCEGKVDEAQSIMKLCDKLTNERAELQAASEEALDTILSQEKQMEVCEVCGAFLIVGDSQTRVDDHLMGKQHMGFAKIKATIEEIKNKKNQEISDREEKIKKEREEREKEREKEREERRNREKEEKKQREREREERRKERDRQRERERSKRSRSREHRSRSHRRRSRSPDRRRSRSRDRRRSRSHDRHRSRSRDRRRSRSHDRRRSRSRDRHSRSRDRHRSKSHGRHRSRSQDRKRSKSGEQRRSRSHDGRRSKSRDRDHHRDRSHSRDPKHGSKKSFDKSSRREEKSEKRSDDKSHQKVHDRNHEDTKRHQSHGKEMADEHHGGSNDRDKQRSMSTINRDMEREQNEDHENHLEKENKYMKGDASDSNKCPEGSALGDEDMKDETAERAEVGASYERGEDIKAPDETSS